MTAIVQHGDIGVSEIQQYLFSDKVQMVREFLDPPDSPTQFVHPGLMHLLDLPAHI